MNRQLAAAHILTVVSSGEGEDGTVPTVYVGPDRPLLRRLEVNGEVFEIRPGEDGGTTYSWVSGPNSGYGFGSSGNADLPEAWHRESILNFLGMIDPATGYIAED